MIISLASVIYYYMWQNSEGKNHDRYVGIYKFETLVSCILFSAVV